ncbi:MAG: hypothetical protein IJL66_06130 [Lachnospiraceae bacterium]|nr:hypothetical protein [Lachnospiraceae bacterium]
MTIELNGHVLTRRKGKWANDGEVIYVGKKATLTVYGGNAGDTTHGSDIRHVEKAYVQSGSSFERENVMFYGGMIHGGNSSNGAGGIHMKSDSKVYLYDTTVAGNRAEQTWNQDGYGGVYTERYNDITQAGTTIIRGNSSKSYTEDNFRSQP